MYTEYTPKDVARFWKYTDKSFHPNGCWMWKSAIDDHGYGTLWWHGKTVKASRISYLLDNGEFSDDLFVLHKCDNPACVNPEHLFLGTVQDNSDDMKSKHREFHPNGAKHPNCRLTQNEVDEIKERCKNGKWGIKTQIAKEFGVSVSHISAITLGIKW